jgi:hypothetical protein
MKQFTEDELRELLREVYEDGFIAGQQNPASYGDKEERDKTIERAIERS